MGKGKVKSKEVSNKPVTKTMLDDAVDTMLLGMDSLFSKFQGEMEGLRIEMQGEFGKMNGRIGKVENRLKAAEVELRWVKDDLKGLSPEYLDTPLRKEFNEPKQRVDRCYPTS